MDDDISRRKAVVEHYSKHLSRVEGIRMLDVPNGVEWNYAYFPILLDPPCNREDVIRRMGERGIFPRKYFSPSVDQEPCYADMAKHCNLPVAHYVATQVLVLPLSSEMDAADAERVSDSLVAALHH